jgi:hypothetical protein
MKSNMKRVVRDAHSKAKAEHSSSHNFEGGEGVFQGVFQGEEDAQTIRGDRDESQEATTDLRILTRFDSAALEAQPYEGIPPRPLARANGEFAPEFREANTLEATQSILSRQGSVASEKEEHSPRRPDQGSRRLLRMPSLLKSRTSISSQTSLDMELESPNPVNRDEEKLVLIGNAKNSGSTILTSLELAYGGMRDSTNGDDGIQETLISRKSAGVRYNYRVYDVIGLHSKEHKWIYSFDKMSTLIYVVDISAYNLPALDDRPSSCVQEDLSLFQQMCSTKWLAMTPILLLLSSTDVLTSRLRDTPLSHYFPDYMGNPTDLEAVKSFFRRKFLCLNQKYGIRIRVLFTDSVATAKLGKVVVANVDKILTEETVLAFGAR